MPPDGTRKRQTSRRRPWSPPRSMRPANPANAHNSLKNTRVFLKLYALAGLAGLGGGHARAGSKKTSANASAPSSFSMRSSSADFSACRARWSARRSRTALSSFRAALADALRAGVDCGGGGAHAGLRWWREGKICSSVVVHLLACPSPWKRSRHPLSVRGREGCDRSDRGEWARVVDGLGAF